MKRKAHLTIMSTAMAVFLSAFSALATAQEVTLITNVNVF